MSSFAVLRRAPSSAPARKNERVQGTIITRSFREIPALDPDVMDVYDDRSRLSTTDPQ